jgi:DNA-binding HxlR family transcriptional regulator
MDVDTAGAAVQLLSGKGTLAVLHELAGGPKRHNELARALGVEHKPLDRTLRRLQDARLVLREVHPVRLQVRYRLAPEARPVLSMLDELARAWRCLRAPGFDAEAVVSSRYSA